MKNKLTDLNDALFAQLERLGDEGLSKERLEAEIARSKALTGVATAIIDTAALQLDAVKFAVENDLDKKRLPPTMGLPAGGEVQPALPGAVPR